MICNPCTRGDHCGKPGEVSTQCMCQHLPREHSTCDHPQADHEPGRGCMHTGCPCLWKAQEQGQPDALARPEPSPVSQDPPAPTRESQSRVRDLDLQAYLKRRRPNA